MNNRLHAFQKLSKQITLLLENGGFDAVINKQSIENKWFTKVNCCFALKALAMMIDETSCEKFYKKYQSYFINKRPPQNIAVISAGNIPCAAFHDFFCVLVSGNNYIGKLSSHDELLLPFIAKILINIEPTFEEKIAFVEKLPKFDKIIATGSNNSARYFEHYFNEFPMLLRKNRNSLAIFNGKETNDDLRNLSVDVFQYFGMGCRSVSKIFVPEDYNFSNLIEIFQEESKDLMFHNAYFNNYEYHRAIYTLNRNSFYDGNSFLLIKNDAFASPISVIYYEEFKNTSELLKRIQHENNNIQCLVSNDCAIKNSINFGKTQYPTLFDYPDKEDILLFCVS